MAKAHAAAIWNRFPSKRKSAGPEGPADLFFFTLRL
jgi:hypothetical protein